jgi:hypothetical protein
MAIDQIDEIVGRTARGELQRATDQPGLVARLRGRELPPEIVDGSEMAVDRRQGLLALGLAQIGETPDFANRVGTALMCVPVDAIA